MPTLRNAVLLLLLTFGPAAVQADTGPGCGALTKACIAVGFAAAGTAKASAETGCVGPLLQGVTGHGLPEVPTAEVAACNVERSLIPVGKPPKVADGTPAPGGPPVPALPWPAGKIAPPNIVLILVDDYSLNLMTSDQDILTKSMPNLARMIRDGVTFSHYFVTDSLCCPSRASIFTGLVPHNSGVFTNLPPDGGYGAFEAHGDDAKSFATLLHTAGYATAMMGKYLNGYLPTRDGVPPGWSEWAVAGEAYTNLNYILNHNGILRVPGPHITDEISILGRAFLAASAARPFFLELASFSPHAPFLPPVRYATAFAGVTYPRTPAYAARPDAAAPAWLAGIPKLHAKAKAHMVTFFQQRMQSDKGVDDMIGAVRADLVALGVDKTTYVIFTSDNGFHLGEYSMLRGKLTPFDTDIHVPLVIVGPDVPPGSSVDALAENIDLAPTVAEIAGVAPPAATDGRSLLGLAQGKVPAAWRKTVLVEHHHMAPDPTDPDAPEVFSGDPPDYAALRTDAALYVEYGTGEVSYYDLKADPYELHNTVAKLSATRRAALHAALLANTGCSGPQACWTAQSMTP